MFLCVYLSCTASAARILTGKARAAAAVAVLVILAFCGWALLAAAVVGAAAAMRRPRGYPPAAGPDARGRVATNIADAVLAGISSPAAAALDDDRHVFMPIV